MNVINMHHNLDGAIKSFKNWDSREMRFWESESSKRIFTWELTLSHIALIKELSYSEEIVSQLSRYFSQREGIHYKYGLNTKEKCIRHF